MWQPEVPVPKRAKCVEKKLALDVLLGDEGSLEVLPAFQL